MRLFPSCLCPERRKVSIHAPREGCDRQGTSTSTYPIKFQFTHPGRGATRELVRHDTAYIVSIHAPREGCDITHSRHRREIQGFQFTHPGRGATDEDYRNYTINFLFQFTHPGRGATYYQLPKRDGLQVSIHAPREGCDMEGWCSSTN